MKKLKNKAGFSLFEMLTAVAILVILITGMEAGLNAGTKAYSSSIFESNSAAMAGIINTALGDVLRYGEEITENPGLDPDPGAMDSFEDAHHKHLSPEDVPFVFTNYEYGVRNAYFHTPILSSGKARGVIQIKDLQCSAPKELVNTGAYPDLEIGDLKITYHKGENFFDVSYSIYDKEVEGRKRDVVYTVRMLNPDPDDIAIPEATSPSTPVVPPSPPPEPDNPGGGEGGGGGETVAPCNHNYVATPAKDVAATCTKAGYKAFVCSKCGDVKTEEIAPLKHQWSEWKIEKAPTDSSKGLKTRYCKRTGCGVLDKKEFAESECHHTYTETPSKDVAATCTKAGAKAYTCSKCGYEKLKTIPALGHIWSDWNTVIQPTIDKEGRAERSCSRAGCKETSVLPISSYVTWNTSSYYGKDTIVIYENKVYIALKGWKNRDKNPATEGKYWKLVENWNSQTEYKFGNEIVYNGIVYKCVKKSINNIPPESDRYWRQA